MSLPSQADLLHYLGIFSNSTEEGMSIEKLKRLARQHSVEYVDLKFVDLPGSWHHITLPVSALEPKLLKNGIGVDGSSLPGFSRIEMGDMIILPEVKTAFIDPFFERPTLSLLGNIMDVGKKVTPYSRNPRRVASDAEAFLTKVVKGAKMMIGPEFEFYLFDRAEYHQGSESAYYDLLSAEDNITEVDEDKSLGYQIPHKGGYHAAPPQDRDFNLRSEICSLLQGLGIGLKYHHHEVGGAGQHEIEVAFSTLLEMADQSMLVKYVVKNQCFRHNKSATFMPKPLYNEPGSGLHVHQYLTDGKRSLFYDKSGPGGFSRLGLHYIGGLLKHVDSILAFTNPSTNSFRRLIPGFEAPVAGTYSVGNRTACVRIPGYQRDPATMRFEFRPPDGTMNPYLAFAAMLMAGIDGIKNKIDPGKPLDKNLDTLSAAELAKIHQLPVSLRETLTALEKDHDYLMAGGVFTEDLIENWIKLKRDELVAVSERPTPYEFELYYRV